MELNTEAKKMRQARLLASWVIGLAGLLLCAQTADPAQSVAIEVKNPDGPACAKWPILTGVPFPKAALRSADQVRLLGPDGRERPCHVNAVATWGPQPDASIRWVHLDFEADVSARGTARYQVEFGRDVSRKAVVQPLKATKTLDHLEIDTGLLRFRVSRKSFRFIDAAWHDANGNGSYEDAEQVLKPKATLGPYLVDQNDVRYDAAKDKAPQVILEESGPMRAVIRAEGWHCAGKTEGLVQGRAGPEAPKDALCKFIVRIVAYRGKPYVRVFHTFLFTADSNKVRLRDIGLPLHPSFEGEVRFGLVKKESRSSSKTNRYLLQVDDERFELHGRAAKKRGGTRAPGWFSIEDNRHGLFVAMRDFWQQYPKELEWTDGRMIVHFWPAHGAPITHPTEKIDASNIHRLWFVHEGRELNFRIPQDYPTKFTSKRAHEFHYVVSAAKRANAIGLSKTHEMLICFARPAASAMHGRTRPAVAQASPRTAASLSRLFNNPPAALPTPAWVCAYGMFDRIHPYDPKQFSEIEKALEGVFDLRQRMEAHTRNKGMFNWGAGHSHWSFPDARWSVHRVWHNTHHGMPRVPWILYLRSGNPKYLRKAVRNTRHVVDIEYCRYTIPEFEKLDYVHGGKTKGALCDYKGLVHWHSGNRLRDYNLLTDFLLYAWYVTGDRRAWEMALEWGEAIKQYYAKATGWRKRPPLSRCGAALTASFIALYQGTWDETYRKFAELNYKRLVGPKSRRPDGGFRGWLTYAPWLTRYVRLTDDAQAKKILLRWADVLSSDLRGEAYDWNKINGNYYHILSEAYHISGSPKCLAVGLGNIQRALKSVWRKPGHLYDGMTWLLANTHRDGYFMQMVPEFLTALSAHRRKGPLPEPSPHTAFRTAWFKIKGHKVQTHEVYIDNAEGTAFKVNVDGQNGYRKKLRIYTAWVLSPSGKEVSRGEAKCEGAGGFRIPLSVPGSGKGAYVLKLQGGGGHWYMSAPVDIQPPKRYVRRLDRHGYRPTAGLAGLPVYVWVPKGTKKFDIRWTSWLKGTPHCVRVYAKSGEQVFARTWVSAKEKEGLRLTVKVPPGQDGGVWKILSGPQASAGFGLSKPIPTVFSICRDKFYVPKHIDTLPSQ